PGPWRTAFWSRRRGSHRRPVPPLPSPRGPISEQLLLALAGEGVPLGALDPGGQSDPLADEDLHLALYLCYELHYRGLPGVDDRWEWEPSLLRLRGKLEQQFERGLLEAVPLQREAIPADDLDLALREIAEADGPPLSVFVGTSAGREQVREFVVHRSAYQLKEADPHSWAIPRLSGAPKAALFEMTSSIPNRRYATGLRRLGFGEDATAFFDEHVVADAVHENVAAVDLAGGLARQEPAQRDAILWGARALSHLDGRWAGRVL